MHFKTTKNVMLCNILRGPLDIVEYCGGALDFKKSRFELFHLI